MTMISMEQEAVPAGPADNVSASTRGHSLPARRHYDRLAYPQAPFVGRHFGSTGIGVVAATAWEAHVLAPFADPTIGSFARGGASRIPSF